MLTSAASPSSAGLRARNGVIQYTRFGRYGYSQIWTMTATGAHRHPLTTGRAQRSYDGSYSPDGKRIVFVRSIKDPGVGLPGELWVMNADGSHKRQLTFTPSIDESDPAWSPNGKKIAFTANGIWIMDAAGRHRRRLASTRLIDSRPSWSPDGTQIAYADTTSSGLPPISGLQIYVVKTSGGSPTNLTSDSSVAAFSRPGRRTATRSSSAAIAAISRTPTTNRTSGS